MTGAEETRQNPGNERHPRAAHCSCSSWRRASPGWPRLKSRIASCQPLTAARVFSASCSRASCVVMEGGVTAAGSLVVCGAKNSKKRISSGNQLFLLKVCDRKYQEVRNVQECMRMCVNFGHFEPNKADSAKPHAVAAPRPLYIRVYLAWLSYTDCLTLSVSGLAGVWLAVLLWLVWLAGRVWLASAPLLYYVSCRLECVSVVVGLAFLFKPMSVFLALFRN